MLKNYFLIAWRNLKKNRLLSLLNIFGLATGLACCLLMTLYINDELRYDRFHKDHDRMYRVVKDFVNEDGSRLPDATTPPALAPAVVSQVPGIESATRIFPSWGGKYQVKYGEKEFYESGIYRADPNVFGFFTFPLLRGDPVSALKEKNAMVITESTAEKYFGSEDPVGKTVDLFQRGNFLVTGVMKDVPENSHFTFDFLLSTTGMGNPGMNTESNWGWYNFYTYIKLTPGTSISRIEPAIQEVFSKNQPGNKTVYYTQPLDDIHLGSHLKWELGENGDRHYIYIFGIISLFVILIAGINYVNLVTAKSSLRAKEIGVRKAVGAGRASLVRQFLAESVLVALFASVFAIFIVLLFLPVFNSVTQKELTLFTPESLRLTGVLVLFAAFTGIVAGIHPALFLSRFRPVLVLKNLKSTGKNSFTLRKVLVVVQFFISMSLIAGTLIINRQLHYMESVNPGFDKEQVLVINNVHGLLNEGSLLEHELKEVPGVTGAAGCDGMLGGQNWTNGVRFKGSANSQLLNFLSVGYDFPDVMGLNIKEGRSFSGRFPQDTADGIILNERAVRDLGIPEPAVGKQIVWDEDEDTTLYATVVGVTRDFHFTSLRSEIKPFAFVVNPGRFDQLAVKINTTDLSSTLKGIEAAWDKRASGRLFDYYFVSDSIGALYRSDRNFRIVFSWFTALAISIACLGLFGLLAFAAEQRTKEIGIRKVLGASVIQILSLLSRDFVKLVIIASVLAIPFAAYAMHSWLQDFSYRISIEWWFFAIAGLLTLLIAFLTVGVQAVKAALVNPVLSLRTE